MSNSEKNPCDLDECGQEFVPYFAKIRKIGQYKKWTREENICYAKFISEKEEIFLKDGDRLPLNIFNLMSKALKINKNHKQCRSHHQKMLLKYKSIQNLVASILQQENKTEKTMDDFFEQDNSCGLRNIFTEENQEARKNGNQSMSIWERLNEEMRISYFIE